MTMADPIFVLGVPRSGTTLLRMMLDSHPAIMCGPEAPWVAGRASAPVPSLRAVVDLMAREKWGAVRGLTGVEEDDVAAAAAGFVDRVMGAAVRAHGKARWADKTPENVIAVPFLARLFPGGRYVHLVRDGRDVALSTAAADWRRIPTLDGRVRNGYLNALRRWRDWNAACRDDAVEAGIPYLLVRYEDLVRDPGTEMRRVLEFVGEPWSDAVLSPHEQRHDVVDPGGEGVKSFFDREGVDRRAIHRWKRDLGPIARILTRRVAEDALLGWGYEPTR